VPSPREILEEYVGLVVEKRVREADISDGSKVKHGSGKHIKDLEARIKQLIHFRDKEKRGSERRATYSRLIGRLKSELASARRSGKVDNSVHENVGGYRDPRGPIRQIIEVGPEPGRVVLSCGHVRGFNPIYSYRVGDDARCFACKEEGRDLNGK